MTTIRELQERAANAIEAGDPALSEAFMKDVGMDASEFNKAVGGGKLYVEGAWMHFFDDSNKESQVRLQVDAIEGKLLAAQQWTGLKFVDVWGDRLRDLEESVIEVNAVHLEPASFGLSYTTGIAPWAQRSMQTINAQPEAAAEVEKTHSSLKSIELVIALPSNFGDGWGYRRVSPTSEYYLNFAEQSLEALDGYKQCDIADVFGDRYVMIEVFSVSDIGPTQAAVERLCEAFKGKIGGVTLDDSQNVDVTTDGITFTVNPAEESVDGVSSDRPLLKDVPAPIFCDRFVPPEYALVRENTNPSYFLAACAKLDEGHEQSVASKDVSPAPGM